MKSKVFYFLLAVFFVSFAISASGSELNGEVIYKKCIACHGAKAEKSYLNKVPVLTQVDPAERLELMKGYKTGTINNGRGKFGMAPVMKGQMVTLSLEEMISVNEYINKIKD